MKILLASSSPRVTQKIQSEMEITLDVAETGEDIFLLLEEESYDGMIVDISLRDADIWSLIGFVNNNILSTKKTRLPIFLIKENSDDYQAVLLASHYGIKILDLSNPLNFNGLLNNNEDVYKPKILIIEDNNRLANGMKLTLEGEYEVDVCNTGQAGIVCWENKKHDLVLLDLMMPGISGEDVLREIRAHNPDQLITIVSARSEKDIQKKLILLGANDYLVKPFSPEQLSKTCFTILTQRVHQLVTNNQENKLDFIINQLWQVLEALENDEIDYAIEIINHITHSMPDRIGDDMRVKLTQKA